MLALLASWGLIMAVCLPVGAALQQRLRPPTDQPRTMVAPPGDRALTAVWLGLLALCFVLACLSLLTPVTVSWLAATAGALALLACSRPAVRDEVRELARAAGRHPRLLAGWLAFALLLGWHATKTVTAYDAGFYHYQHIHWLATHGLVRGLALIHDRFAFPGSWFALAAGFDHGALEARVLRLGGGLVMLLLASQWLLSARRWWQGRAEAQDRYATIGIGLGLVYVLDKGWFNASSPDAAVFALTLLAGWAMLATAHRDSLLAAAFAIGALSMKQSALALLLLALLPLPMARRWQALLLAAPVLLLLAAQSFIAGGCLLYPVAHSCVDVPWGVGPAIAARQTDYVFEWARWLTPAPEHAPLLGWLPVWTRARALEIALYMIAALALWRQRARWRAMPGAGAALLLGAGGVAYGMLTAPDPRFFSACIFVLLGVAGANATQQLWRNVVTTLVALGLVVLLAATVRQARLQDWLLPPRPAPVAVYQQVNARGLATSRPVSGDQCWATPLPCTHEPVADDVELRVPAQGYGAGFEHRPAAAPRD